MVSSFSDPDGRNGLDPDDRYGSDHPDDVRFSVFAVGACAKCVILDVHYHNPNNLHEDPDYDDGKDPDPDDRNDPNPDDQYGSDHPDDVRFSVFAVGACDECVILEGEHKWIPGATESHIGKNKILPFCKSLPQTDF